MSTASSIVGIVPGLQATALVGYNLGEMEFGLNQRKRRKKNHIKRITRMGITNLMAIPLIKVTAQQVNLIP